MQGQLRLTYESVSLQLCHSTVSVLARILYLYRFAPLHLHPSSTLALLSSQLRLSQRIAETCWISDRAIHNQKMSAAVGRQDSPRRSRPTSIMDERELRNGSERLNLLPHVNVLRTSGSTRFISYNEVQIGSRVHILSRSLI